MPNAFRKVGSYCGQGYNINKVYAPFLMKRSKISTSIPKLPLHKH